MIKRNSLSQLGVSTTRVILSVFLLCIGASLAVAALTITLVPGTNVLLSKTSGNGGNTSSVTSSTNIFSPSVFVDYKRFGGEPTVTVDRYAFTGTPPAKTQGGNMTLTCTATTPCFPDISYVSGPNGFVFPHYSPFFKSDDRGETFRVPSHVPGFGQTFGTGGGGGDSFQIVGQLSHKVFFVDLPGPGCVTMNISSDLGETWHSNQIGCGLNPGAIDDRQWDEADEFGTTTRNVYVTFINFTNDVAPSIGFARSEDDGETYFLGDCSTLTDNAANPIPTNPGTFCPDEADTRLQVAGPIVADKNGTTTRTPTHNLYVPFVRGGNSTTAQVQSGPPWEIWVAKSTDKGNTWTQTEVAALGQHNPVNLFPQLMIDTSGNLFITWAQTQQAPNDTDPTQSFTGEQDVYYAFSTDGGAHWSAPINLTKEANDSAVMPWMVAGDAGRVDLVYYKANTGLNSNVAEIDSNGNPCTPPLIGPDTCAGPNPSVWNVFFAQSINALNTGPNFQSVQISDHPNHLGQICTSGLGCSTTSGDRDLLDFFTVDIDHVGAANVVWADDNTTRGSDTRNKFSRQLSGVSVFKNTTISLLNTWPIKDHAVTDPKADTTNLQGTPIGSCSPMDVLAASANRNGDLITIGITLNGLPNFTGAVTCGGGAPVTGGIWGAEFWAASPGNPTGFGESFYIAYRDNPPDAGSPRVEAGRMANTNATVTTLEFKPDIIGTPLGQCTTADGMTALPGSCTVTRSCTANNATCTLTMTVPASLLNIKSGSGMFSITGLSAYEGGTAATPPFLRVQTGNSEQADAAAPFDVAGTGTTSP